MINQTIDLYYLRLSLEDNDNDESHSISSQRMYIKNYIRNHSELGNVEEYIEFIDDGYSGTNMNRPGIKKILELVETGMVRTIIVKDLSRFARNYLEAGHYLEFVFPTFAVRFIAIADNFDSAELNRTGGFELAIRNLINQMYSKDLSKKIKSAVDLKKMNGEYVYGTAPYGYKKGKEKNTIVIDNEAAKIVYLIFESAAKGMTLTQIAKMLNDRQITTPSMYLKDVRGNYKTSQFWTFSSIKNIIKNRIYTGDTVPFKSYVKELGSNQVKVLAEEDWVVIPDTHIPIITRELYYQAQNTIKKHNTKIKKNESVNLFATLLVCGICGRKLKIGRNKKWKCETARYVSDTECKSIAITEDKLKKIVLNSIQSKYELLDNSLKIESRNHDQQNHDEKKIQQLKRQLENSKETKLRYYESFINGTISKELYMSIKQDANIAEEEIKEKLLELENKIEHNKTLKVQKETIFAQTNSFIQLFKSEELSNNLLKELIKKIIIYENTINIVWNFKDDLQIDD